MNKDLRNSELYEECYGEQERRANFRFYTVILVVAFLLLGFRGYWTNTFGGVEVDGSSMYRTLSDGERLLMKKVDGDEADYGDVIVVYVGEYPEFSDGTEYLIKRLIAKAGDRVRCTDGDLEIKYAGAEEWTKIAEPYAYYTSRADYDFVEYAVGEGEVFFLGDNRNISQDSRYLDGGSRLKGLYKEKDIIGIVPKWAIEHRKTLAKIFF